MTQRKVNTCLNCGGPAGKDFAFCTTKCKKQYQEKKGTKGAKTMKTLLTTLAVTLLLALPLAAAEKPAPYFSLLALDVEVVKDDFAFYPTTDEKPDLFIHIFKNGWQTVKITPTAPNSFNASWELWIYQPTVKGSDSLTIYLLDADTDLDLEETSRLIYYWETKPTSGITTLTTPKGSTVKLHFSKPFGPGYSQATQELVAKPWQRICPSCGALVTTCYRPDPPEPIQEWHCSKCGHVIYEG